MGRSKGTGLSVFKGREAKLNRAIFQALALKGPQTAYDIHKNVKRLRELRYAYYGNVNKRIRDLEVRGYVIEAGFKKTKAGFEAIEYELSAKAYLVLLLDSVTLENLVTNVSEELAIELLAILISFRNPLF